MPARHSGDQVHKVKKTAAPLFYILLLQACANVKCDKDHYRSGTCAGKTNGYKCNTCDNIQCAGRSNVPTYRTGKCEGTTNGFECKTQPTCGKGQFLKGATATAGGECTACPKDTFRSEGGHRHSACTRSFTSPPPFCAMGETADFAVRLAAMLGRHSGDQVHKVKKNAAPLVGILLF